jgi:hypothetical protein
MGEIHKGSLPKTYIDELSYAFELSGAYPATFTNAAGAFVAPFALAILDVILVVEQPGSGGYTEIDLVAGSPDGALATVLSTKPRVPGNSGVWGMSGVTAGGQAAVVDPAKRNWAKGTIMSVNITSDVNQPSGASSATVIVRYRRT